MILIQNPKDIGDLLVDHEPKPKTVDESVYRDGSQKYRGLDVHNWDTFVQNPDVVNVADITGAYNRPGEVDTACEFTRSLVFIRSGYLIIFDRVETVDESFKKRWLLHLEGEP